MNDVHASDAPMAGDPHGLGDPGEDHGHDDHGQTDDSLGPIDWPAYGAGLLGAAIGMVIAWAFVLSKWVASS
jgi:hypothetical protein